MEIQTMRNDHARAVPSTGGAASARSRILVIEPDAASRDIVALLVRYYGYDVLAAASFTEAMHLARALRPDGIVAELLVDSHGDRTIVDALARDAATARTPLLLLSETLSSDARGRALAKGAVAVLAKPVNGQELRDALVLHVGKPAQAAPSRTAA
jgi:CheY-like chemotaxis protein